MTPSLHIERDDGTCSPDDESFRRWVNAAFLQSHGQYTSAPEISLRINNAAEMADLNQRFRGREGPTNVLSFPADLPTALDYDLLGDIAICAPLVETEARDQGKPVRHHWAHLTVHGVLHLLGYDHQSEFEAQAMERLEIAILEQLNVPNPYIERDLNLRAAQP